MDRAEKEKLVAGLNETLGAAAVIVVTHYSGLNVAEMTELRRGMRKAGARFAVTKNRLTRRALEGTPYVELSALFTGPTAIAFSSEVTAAPKAAAEYAKRNEKLVILGGAMGETVLDAAGVKALAALPSLDELRARLVGTLTAPATKVARVLQAPGGQLARVFSAYGAKDDGD